MRSNERLQRILATRHLGGPDSAVACDIAEAGSSLVSDARLFALTFAGGFLFMTVFIA